MFIEHPDDAKQAELFALGLIKEPKDNGTLVLVPCRHKLMCRTHGTLRIRLRMLTTKIRKAIPNGRQ
jgi:hypothetical protein